jgi:hypothetical protein
MGELIARPEGLIVFDRINVNQPAQSIVLSRRNAMSGRCRQIEGDEVCDCGDGATDMDIRIRVFGTRATVRGIWNLSSLEVSPHVRSRSSRDEVVYNVERNARHVLLQDR